MVMSQFYDFHRRRHRRTRRRIHEYRSSPSSSFRSRESASSITERGLSSTRVHSALQPSVCRSPTMRPCWRRYSNWSLCSGEAADGVQFCVYSCPFAPALSVRLRWLGARRPVSSRLGRASTPQTHQRHILRRRSCRCSCACVNRSGASFITRF